MRKNFKGRASFETPGSAQLRTRPTAAPLYA
jgi:hypothetical protein